MINHGLFATVYALMTPKTKTSTKSQKKGGKK